MQSSLKRILFLTALTLGVSVMPTFAQEYEIHGYAGGLLSMTDFNSTLTFKKPAIFGLKGGAFVTDNLMVEGNAGWVNQINFKGYSYRTGGILYEGAGTYNFYRVRTRGVVPFATFGLGGLTIKARDGVNMNDHNQVVYTYPLANPQPTAGPIPNTLGVLVTRDNDTFFNFSYGGGVRAQRLWGPLGLRADVRGRTVTGFYGTNVTGLEATGGLLFSWGER
jgi:hypothetical protein